MHLERILKASSLYLVGNIAMRAVGFLLVPLYAHYLTPADYGTVELVDLLINIAALSVGLQAAGTAMVRLYHEDRDERERSRIISTTLVVVAALSLILALGGVLGSGTISRLLFHTEARSGIISAFFVAMFFGGIAEICMVYLRLRDQPVLFVIYSLATLVATAGLNIYFIAYAGQGIWGFVFSKLIVTGAGSLFLMARTFREVGVHVDWSAAKRLMRFGSPLIFSGLGVFTLHFSDRFFLNAYSDPTQLGQYALAYRFAFVIPLLVADPFNRAWNVNFYELAEREGWRALFARVLRFLLFLMAFGALGLSVLAGPLLRVMVTPAYYPAIGVIPVVVFAYVFRQVGEFLRDLMLINKRSVMIGQVTAGIALLNIGLNFAWIPPFGMRGAAWATLASWAAYLAVFWLLTYRQYRFPFPVRSMALVVLGSIGVVIGSAATLPASLVGGSLAGLAWVALFVAVLWKAGYFPPADRAEIYEKAGMVRSKIAAWRAKEPVHTGAAGENS